MSKKSKKPAQSPPEFSMALWESLWRVVDAARLAISLPEGVDREEVMSFLADQEKMLRRCLGGESNEAELRAGVTEHPYVQSVRAAEHARVQELLAKIEKKAWP
jgi:hypothetical protein